jgi:large subunit ribosomal protein L23
VDSAQIILEPIITEKAITAKKENRYLFRVHPKANKIEIKRAVEALFKVSVQAVNTVAVKGKSRMLGFKPGNMPSYKKAYVTVKAGQKIEELEV